MHAYTNSSENVQQISEELLAHRCGILDGIFEGGLVILVQHLLKKCPYVHVKELIALRVWKCFSTH